MRQLSSTREWNSADYHRLSQPQVSWGKKVLSRLHLRGDETVLDAGCGTGRLTAELAEALPRGRVVGIDLSQNMVETAKQHLAGEFGVRVHLLAVDLLHLPFEQAFDGIVSTAAFHWVLDHDRLFLNLHRALRPGGWLEAQCGGGPNLKRLRNRTSELIATPKFARFFSGFREPWLFEGADEAAHALRGAGFTDVETSTEAAPTVLAGKQQYIDFVRTMILRQHLMCIPDEKLQIELLENLADQTVQDNPPFLLDYWRLNLHGKNP